MQIKRAVIEVNGLVQGVGFRPFIQRLAAEIGLTGSAENREYGVGMELYGSRRQLDLFLARLQNASPPGSRILGVRKVLDDVTSRPPAVFVIRPSRKEGAVSTFVPPDLGICSRCLREMADPDDRRYRYPFITCNDCGPRFTLIRSLPYDRRSTAMDRFEMCRDCRGEYESVFCRRCHAQIISCPRDGPVLTFWDGGRAVTGNEPALRAAQKYLHDGAIVAVKGIGGYHLACRADNETSIGLLRRLKNRPSKPLALMARDLETVARYALLGAAESGILSGPASPIVVLPKRDRDLLPGIAPGLDTLGFMLPYTPLHRLLLEETPVLVMTSGNIEGEAIVKDDETARATFASITSHVLAHDREILNRCDDSLIRSIGGREVFLRRSRGYVPLPFMIPSISGHLPVLAAGADLKACFGLSKNGTVWLSQYLGDLEHGSNQDAYLESLDWFTGTFDVQPELVVTDMHPDYFSRRLGEEYAERHGLAIRAIQHHKAHIYSVMAEHGLSRAIGIACDGTGYGEDGRIWGGEFFLLEGGREERLAHLDYIPMPGGERAIAEPGRLALSYLVRVYGQAWERHYSQPVTEKIETIAQLLRDGWDHPLTSSLGRLFDAAAALLGLCLRQSYDGEAPCLLEAAAAHSSTDRIYGWSMDQGVSPWKIDVGESIDGLVTDREAGVPVAEIARAFHNTIAGLVTATASAIAGQYGESRVCLSGGVLQNTLLAGLIEKGLIESGLKPCFNREAPPNDGGIALGQIYGLWQKEHAHVSGSAV